METTLAERFDLADIVSPDFTVIQDNIYKHRHEVELVCDAVAFEYPGPSNSEEEPKGKVASARERARLFACAASEAHLLVLALNHAAAYHEFLALVETDRMLVRDSLAKVKRHAEYYEQHKNNLEA